MVTMLSSAQIDKSFLPLHHSKAHTEEDNIEKMPFLAVRPSRDDEPLLSQFLPARGGVF